MTRPDATLPAEELRAELTRVVTERDAARAEVDGACREAEAQRERADAAQAEAAALRKRAEDARGHLRSGIEADDAAALCDGVDAALSALSEATPAEAPLDKLAAAVRFGSPAPAVAGIEAPEVMAERLYPPPKSAPNAGHKARAIASRSIRARDEQIRRALLAEAKHQDWCGPYPIYAGAAKALRAFATRLGKDAPR